MKKYREIGARLKELRAKLTFQEFAQKLDIPVRTYLRYETGERAPTIEILTKVAEIYKLSLDWVILGRGTVEESSKAVEDSKREQLQDIYETQCAACGLVASFVKAEFILSPVEGDNDIFDKIILLCPNCRARYERKEEITREDLQYFNFSKIKKMKRRDILSLHGLKARRIKLVNDTSKETRK